MNRLRSNSLLLGLATLALSLATGAATGGQTTGPVKVKSITLGLVSGTSQQEIEAHFQNFVRYVARKLGSGSDIEGKVVVVPAPLQMAKLLEEKKIDFYMESPYPTYLINRLGAAVLLVRRWKSGMAEYRSLIFSKKDNAISRLEDLRGKMIAFEDPGSTSGYFLPKVLLLKKGFKLTEKPRPDANVGPKEIGYVFASQGKKSYGARFRETSRSESRALLSDVWLQSRPPHPPQRTGDRCPNYLESKWFPPLTLDSPLSQRRAL